MIIYLVNNGQSYSDYSIMGVFPNKEAAQRFAEREGGEIEEWEETEQQRQEDKKREEYAIYLRIKAELEGNK